MAGTPAGYSALPAIALLKAWLKRAKRLQFKHDHVPGLEVIRAGAADCDGLRDATSKTGRFVGWASAGRQKAKVR
jgi:hypothetical protein